MRRHLTLLTTIAILLLLPSAVHASPGTLSGTASSSWLQGWPTLGHDPQRTNRSLVVGPTHPRLLLTRPHVSIGLVAPDGTMYGCGINRARRGGRSASVALDASGHTRWTYRFCIGFAGIAGDGTVAAVGVELPRSRTMFYDSDTTAAGFSSAGTLLWKIKPFGLLKGSEPAVSDSGVLYVSPLHVDAYEGLSAIAVDTGKVVLHTPGAGVSALAPDGTIYAAGIDLRAYDAAGTLRWQRTYPFDDHFNTLTLVGQDGTIYLGNGPTLLAYSPSGNMLWQRTKRDDVLALAQRADGVLLVGGERTLDAVTKDGTQLWEQALPPSTQYSGPSVVVDAAGTAYVGTRDGKLRIYSADAVLFSNLRAGPATAAIVPTAILAPSGRLIVNGTDGTLRIYGS